MDELSFCQLNSRDSRAHSVKMDAHQIKFIKLMQMIKTMNTPSSKLLTCQRSMQKIFSLKKSEVVLKMTS